MKKEYFLFFFFFIINMKLFILNLFTFRNFINVLGTTLVSLTIRYLFLYYEIDILDVLQNPGYSIISLFSIGFIRIIIRNILELYFQEYATIEVNENLLNRFSNSQVIANFQDNASSQTAGSSENVITNPQTANAQTANAQTANAQEQNAIPSYIGDGFRIVNDTYIIDDPTQVATRGYLDPVTMAPYASCQPYARNLSNAMTHSVGGGNTTAQMFTARYGFGADRFFNEFMRYNHPNRSPNSY